MTAEVLELTPPGAGGVSVIRLRGTDAFEHAHLLAPGARPDVRGPQLVRLRVGDEDLDEALLCVIAPGEIELHVHGSPPLVRRIVEGLRGRVSEGRSAGRENFRTAGHARRGTVEEQARERLSRAVSDSGARILLDQAEGALRHALRGLRHAGLDERKSAIQAMLERGRVARFALEPVEVVLAGAVNTGKSTLFNLLLGEDRVIVSEEAGTTRDVVRERARLGAYPILLTDTAGERESPGASPGDLLERASQRQALRARRAAELVLWLARVDAPHASPLDPEARSLLRGASPGGAQSSFAPASMTDLSSEKHPSRARLEIVHTQADRVDPGERNRFPAAISAVYEPARTRARIRELFQAAFELPDEPWSGGSAVPFGTEWMRGVSRLALDAPPDAWMRALEELLGAD